MNEYGETLEINMTRNGNIAFVDFIDAESALKAKNALHHTPGLGSESLVVDYKKDISVQGPPSRRNYGVCLLYYNYIIIISYPYDNILTLLNYIRK